MDPQLLTTLNAARRNRQAAVLVTELEGGNARLVMRSESVAGDLGAAIGKTFLTGKSGVVEADGERFFLNVHLPSPRMVIIGAVHISQALAPMAAMTGFDVKVIDPRTAFATQDRFANVDLVADWPEDALRDRPLDAFTALVAVTHDPKIDDWPLISALQTQAFYVGALGSRKTHAKRVERLMQAGLSQGQIARIAAPIGLDIGAQSPEEIAVAILAQTIAALRKPEDTGGA
ncbi:MAG: XdhC family protein [Hoeflea sp.]|uniref:XdhC family protein n=1 Tax=Hoeflea sp. TaxID=1940281 RepID=UPI001DF78F12|nr:XdhC family protein [Hoeflea sp.]MBU4530372.1 XdhC family protein [Alphaproteobacteria bacterium]MBU4545159.1 XdhC family protein [Alphaproteobacteria bacterium]MBU4549641.1 XdhC family protein [Alphaproteobacteria bacterium]MBV1721962.1 XdhC family protein [Hoeflea sp.]MBV1761312.1 XdhC family protein [Hoeflea sp.]